MSVLWFIIIIFYSEITYNNLCKHFWQLPYVWIKKQIYKNICWLCVHFNWKLTFIFFFLGCQLNTIGHFLILQNRHFTVKLISTKHCFFVEISYTLLIKFINVRNFFSVRLNFNFCVKQNKHFWIKWCNCLVKLFLSIV